MGSTWTRIGHGRDQDAAIAAACAFITTYGYRITHQAEWADVEGIFHRFIFVEGWYWYECTLEVTQPKDKRIEPTFLASLKWRARFDELRQKYPGVEITNWVGWPND